MPALASLLFEVSLFIVGGYAIICSDEFTAVGSSCYYISNDYKSWPDANSTCVRKGGYLVTINSAEENSNLFQWLNAGKYYWSEWFLGPYIGMYNSDEDSNDFGCVCTNMQYIKSINGISMH